MLKKSLISLLIFFNCLALDGQSNYIVLKLKYTGTDDKDCPFVKVKVDSSQGILVKNLKNGFFETLVPKGKAIELKLEKDTALKKDNFYILLTAFQNNGQRFCETPGYQTSKNGKVDGAVHQVSFYNP